MDNPSLTIALAMVAGVLAQSLARHARVPGIVLLLATGVILGPDMANLIRPAVAGEGLNAFVGFAVAIILFEGGLHMNLKKLREQARPIRRLVTVGALVTGAGGAAVCALIMGWDWRLSTLFGTLVIVTGPTVITPLLRRLRVQKNVSTILEAEGIFIDAVGATIAVVALEVLLSERFAGVFQVITKIGIGAGVGLAGGAILAVLLSRRRVIPEGLENIVSLGFAVAIFQISHAIAHESGITAAIVAGMVISNTDSHAFDEIVEFKEQLVSLLIATLFVLLAADVRKDDVLSLGYAGVFTVLALMFVVRPITVAISTYKTDLTWREKAFLSWLAPRGIVAAAVASLFAVELLARGNQGGSQMKALVFMVIAITVTVQGLSGGIMARLLGVKRPTNLGYAILGANPLARAYGRTLRAAGDPVILIDSGVEACEIARNEGFEVVLGNGLEARTMDLAMLDARRAVIGLTTNENINYLFARKVKDAYRGARVYIALETRTTGVTIEMIKDLDVELLFGAERHLQLWASNVGTDRVNVETWELELEPDGDIDLATAPIDALLPLAVRPGGVARRITPAAASTTFSKQDKLRVAIFEEHREEALTWLRDHGFVPVGGRMITAPATAPADEPT